MAFIMKGSEEPRRKAEAPRWFKTFKSFNRCAPFKPPLWSSRGSEEDLKEGVERL